MSTVNNMLIKKYIRLRNIYSQCNLRFNIFNNCLNLLDTDNFDESKFDDITSRFSETINVDKESEFTNELQEFLSVNVDVDLEEYIKMIETINDYYVTKLFLKTLLTKEDKINYILLD